jgi:hypothetical protein
MNDESKALPEWTDERGTVHWLERGFAGARIAGTPLCDPEFRATEADLSAVLAAMEPEPRSRVIRAALSDPTLSDFSLANEYARQATEAERELAAERAKVAELTREERFAREALAMANREVDGLCVKLAKVEAERDGMWAFFAEHGECALTALHCFTTDYETTKRWNAALDSLSATLATLPKGTTES